MKHISGEKSKSSRFPLCESCSCRAVLFASFSDNAQVGRYSAPPPSLLLLLLAFSGDPAVSNRPGFRGSKVGSYDAVGWEKLEALSQDFVCSLEGKVRPTLGLDARVPTKCQVCPFYRKERIRGEVGGGGSNHKNHENCVEKQQGQETYHV